MPADQDTGDAAAADTSREDAASNATERRAARATADAEDRADASGRRAEHADDAGEAFSERAGQAGHRLYGQVVGLGAAGEGEAPVRAVELLGRVGLVGYGLVHVLIGVIAVHVAVAGGGQPDQQGALGSLLGNPVGVAVVVVLVVGLLAFALWQGMAAAAGFRWTSGGVRFRKRVGAGAKTVAVLGVALAGARLLVGSGGSSSASSEAATGGLLALPAGRLLVVAVGVVVLVVAGATAYTGIARNFSDDLDYDRLPDHLRRPVEVLGVAGHVARALAFAVVGVLFGVAALADDATRAGGLDQALTALAAQPYGPLLLLAVALGFVAFGVYTFAEAWCRRI
ncbi:DUF1206 domain-containing protein [Actinomycetospora atypica]|uniref:DUF1206 domain-containing protein n=1 Tax=Actinomycetospora atypica TaxID=1290095 RepID=A0ABV9YJT8_9PSEU